MVEELKIRIHDYKRVEENLKRLGAKFTEEINVVDTYFKQPAGEVLKITEDDKGNFLVNLKLKEGKFQILKYEKIDDVDKLKKELTDKFGVKCILKKKRRFFDFEDFMININLIEDVGEFLIVEGENISPEIITEKLGIKNPEFIRVSFDELKLSKLGRVWKGVIIEESLDDKSLLNLVRMVKSKKTTLEEESERGFLTFLYIELDDEKKDEFVKRASTSIKDRFYLHICKEEKMIVIFKDKIFKFSSDELDEINRARDYGLSIGILREQMPFEELIKDPYG